MDIPDEFDWDSAITLNTQPSNIDVDNLALNTNCNFQSSYSTLNLTDNTDRRGPSVCEPSNQFSHGIVTQPSCESSVTWIDPDFDEFFSSLIDFDISLELLSGQSYENPIQVINDSLQISDIGQYSDHILFPLDEPRLTTFHESIINVTEDEREQEKLIQSEKDRMDLITIDNSIRGHSRSMSIKTEPPDHWRRRYKIDGKRHIPKSRVNPVEINLSNLKGLTLNAHVSVWIEVTLITTKNNPKNTHLVHTNYLEYHDGDAYQNGHASVRIRITPLDIQQGVKRFPCLSIIGMKYDDYNYELIPYGPSAANNSPEKYTIPNENKTTNAAKAKTFIKDYDLKSCHIGCRLVIKQNGTWHTTDIGCQTRIIDEKKCEGRQNNATKRSTCRASEKRPSEDESSNMPMSTPAKRQKQSQSPIYQLPVVYSNIHSTDPEDHH